MDKKIRDAIFERVGKEPYARKMGLRLLDVDDGYAAVEMTPTEENENIHGMLHGAAIFSLIDEAFEVSSNSHGTVAVALNETITYHRAPDMKSILRAESREIHRTRKTATYDIKVTDGNNALIASCIALVYRKGLRLPFLGETGESPGRGRAGRGLRIGATGK